MYLSTTRSGCSRSPRGSWHFERWCGREDLIYPSARPWADSIDLGLRFVYAGDACYPPAVRGLRVLGQNDSGQNDARQQRTKRALMKITLLGHASILVQMKSVRCLMDPVFFDPFEEGAVVSCPRRTVFPERFPPIDILIVSHRHPDHFDIRSLAQVPRDCDAICPDDPLIVYALKQLGFGHIHPVPAMAPVQSADFELFPTRSEMRTVREFGMVFRDATGTFWNQVDSFLSGQTIETVLERFGGIDLHFAMYASQNFEFFDSLSTRFPFETHRDNLENVLRIQPRAVAPGAAGFRFGGDHAWLNAFLFPVSRERFLADLQSLDPQIQSNIMNPGDEVDVQAGRIEFHQGASNLVRMEEDDTFRIGFDPTAPVPPLADPNSAGYSQTLLVQITEAFILGGLQSYVRSRYDSADPVIQAYRRHHVCYAIGIVFPDTYVRWFEFEFAPDGPQVTTRDHRSVDADLVHRIAASALLGWIAHDKSFFYVRAYSRRFSTLYALDREEGMKAAITPVKLPDLLMHYVLNVAPGARLAAKHQIDKEIQRLP